MCAVGPTAAEWHHLDGPEHLQGAVSGHERSRWVCPSAGMTGPDSVLGNHVDSTEVKPSLIGMQCMASFKAAHSF